MISDKITVSGIVERPNSSVTKAGLTYGVVINNTKYGFFTTNPPCNEGDSVSFSAKENGDFWNADPKSLKLITAGSSKPTPVTAPPTAKSAWVPDKDRQDSIIYQSARKDALEFLKILNVKDMIDLGKSKSKGGMIESMEIYLDKYTQRFFEDTKNLGHSSTLEAEGLKDDLDSAEDKPY